MSQLHHNRGAGSALHVWLVAQYHFQLYYINPRFIFTLWAEQWKFYKDGIGVYLRPCPVPTDRAWYPAGIGFILQHCTFLLGELLLCVVRLACCCFLS